MKVRFFVLAVLAVFVVALALPGVKAVSVIGDNEANLTGNSSDSTAMNDSSQDNFKPCSDAVGESSYWCGDKKVIIEECTVDDSQGYDIMEMDVPCDNEGHVYCGKCTEGNNTRVNETNEKKFMNCKEQVGKGYWCGSGVKDFMSECGRVESNYDVVENLNLPCDASGNDVCGKCVHNRVNNSKSNSTMRNRTQENETGFDKSNCNGLGEKECKDTTRCTPEYEKVEGDKGYKNKFVNCGLHENLTGGEDIKTSSSCNQYDKNGCEKHRMKCKSVYGERRTGFWLFGGTETYFMKCEERRNKVGDLNGNNEYEINDAIEMLEISQDKEYKSSADMNGDKRVDEADVISLLKKVKE